MPISQSRLIAQTNAAFIALEALNRIRSFIHAQDREITVGNLPIAAAYAELVTLIADNDRLFPPTTVFSTELQHLTSTYEKITQLVTTELSHFRRNAQANELARLRSERFRDRKAPTRKRKQQHKHSIFESPNIIPQPPNPPFASPSPQSPLPSNPIEITQEEFDKAVAAAGGVYVPDPNIEVEEQEIMKKEQDMKGKW